MPVWVAALGDHATRVATELSDGWIPAFVTRDRLPAWAAELSQPRKTAAPGAEELTVASGPITAVGENPDAARDLPWSTIEATLLAAAPGTAPAAGPNGLAVAGAGLAR